MRDFKNLAVWEKSHQFVLDVYQQTSDFPKSEVYGLTSQIRRASVSIPSNIAEGYGRRSDKETARFFVIAYGSAKELEYQILLARDLGYLGPANYQRVQENLSEIQKMLYGFIQKLKA